MEVTSTNFKEVLPAVQEAIKSATFLAIDCEFSGLNTAQEINAFDTPKQYYEKVHRSCKEFLLIQYGISAFRFDPAEGRFHQQTYNFYIFRRPINRNIPDQRFLCQTNSINFLASQGFDFNKLFKYGISYLNTSEETDYRHKLEERQKARNHQNANQQNSPGNMQIPEDLQSTIDDIMKQLDDFLVREDEELQLPKQNAFVRRLVYQSVGPKYKNKIVLRTKQLENKDRILVAAKFKSKEELDIIEKNLLDEELVGLDDFIGFTKVLRCVVDSAKLIIGHNMSLDFLHMIDKFLIPLPHAYEEFKECAYSLFRNILDTKFMATAPEFQNLFSSTVLKDLLKTVSTDPFEVPQVTIEDGGQGYSLNDGKEHEAGYDAYITGLCFISLWSYLGKLKDISKNNTFEDFTLLKPFLNKLYLSALKDHQYIHLSGVDPKPSRDHVFYLTFPKEWKLNNILELFSPFGNVFVAWLDETSAYVGLYKKDKAAVALKTLSQSDTYNIITYAKRQMQLDGIVIPTPPVSTYKRKRAIGTPPQGNNKKMKFGQCSYSKRFQPILEDVEAEPDCSANEIDKESSKTFAESDVWD